MTPPQAHTEGLKNQPAIQPAPTDLVEFGRNRFKAWMEVQKQMLDAFQKINLGWFERTQSAVSRNSELIAKLTAARTMSETTNACQQCLDTGIRELVEDGRQTIADGQKIMDLSMRVLTNGQPVGGGTT